MNIILWLIVGLFCVKIVWNLGVPYVLLRRPIDDKTGRSRGVSMATAIEFFFLIVAIGVSACTTGDGWLHQPLKVASYGMAAIIASYLHLVIVGIVGGWLASKNSDNP
jgi:Kef-type K+ transport system membrane component KefB